MVSGKKVYLNKKEVNLIAQLHYLSDLPDDIDKATLHRLAARLGVNYGETEYGIPDDEYGETTDCSPKAHF